MTTQVRLFVNMKNEDMARPLGLRRLRNAPGRGQRFEVAVDGRPVRARITRFSTAIAPGADLPVPDVYAEEF
ncbi:MAG TPA: hypothetical protein VN832_09970 [Stellaceae bacterium]|nr:hypothetical protein [Stellaceae bacterium]